MLSFDNLGLEIVRASTITPKAYDWLWEPWLCKGKLHLLAGQGGSGKTTIALAIAAALTTGKPLPDGSVCGPHSVLMWSGEDDLDDTLIPRALAAGADLDRLHFIGSVLTPDGKRSFDPKTDFDLVAWADFDPKLLIIDPISTVATDANDTSKVRTALGPLVAMCQSKGIAILGITHFAKGTKERPAVERVLGSQAWTNAARIVWVTVTGEDEEGNQTYGLTIAKSNIGPTGGGWSYSSREACIDGITSRAVEWGVPLEGSVSAVLKNIEAHADERQARNDAEDWLFSHLNDSKTPAAEIYALAKAAGYSVDRIKRASVALKVTKTKDGFCGGWQWSL